MEITRSIIRRRKNADHYIGYNMITKVKNKNTKFTQFTSNVVMLLLGLMPQRVVMILVGAFLCDKVVA